MEPEEFHSARDAMSYYILQGGDTKGPYTLGQLRTMWNAGQFTTETLHCREGDSEWHPLQAILNDLEPPPVVKAPAMNVQTKTLLAVAILMGLALITSAWWVREREKNVDHNNGHTATAYDLHLAGEAYRRARADSDCEAAKGMEELGLSVRGGFWDNEAQLKRIIKAVKDRGRSPEAILLGAIAAGTTAERIRALAFPEQEEGTTEWMRDL